MSSARSNDLLRDRHCVWEKKPALRAIYTDFHRRLEAACPRGPLLDIGSGSAHFKAARPDVVSLDILPFDGIDIVADAHRMPLPNASFSGIVMLDVLHHLQRPLVFLREAARVLKPGGRLALIEPGMSFLSTPVYRHLHHEPVEMAADPFDEQVVQSGGDPWDSNQAIPTLMFSSAKTRQRLAQAVPELSIVEFRWLGMLAYPLSGGFQQWSLLSESMVQPLLKAEVMLSPLGRWLAFRIHVVLERVETKSVSGAGGHDRQ